MLVLLFFFVIVVALVIFLVVVFAPINPILRSEGRVVVYQAIVIRGGLLVPAAPPYRGGGGELAVGILFVAEGYREGDAVRLTQDRSSSIWGVIAEEENNKTKI